MTTAPPSPRQNAESEAVAAYETMWDDMASAAAIPDYQSSALAEHASGEALTTLVEGVYSLHLDGLVAKGTLVSDARVVEASPSDSPTKVELEDCLDGRDWLNYTTDGALENDVPGGFHQTTATVEMIDGRWMVTELFVGGVGTC